MAGQAKEKKQLGHEYIAANEDDIAANMVNELEAQLNRMYAGNKKMLRQIHTKMHGVVKAWFTIEPNLPEDLKIGLFRESKTFHAWVRLSNASTVPKADGKKDVRGLAIKIMGVPGDKILNDEHLQSTQDFLLMNTETFFSRNVKEFSGLLSAFTSASKLKLLAYLLNPAHWSKVKAAASANIHCNNPFSIPYWSTQPYQFGSTSRAVKYFLKPSGDNKILIENEREYNYLRVNMAQTLNSHTINYEFFVQFQTDADTMPIEDPTIPWSSQYIRIATLKIPPQEFDSKEQMEFGDNLSFNSWHSLPEHRPLGSFNRIRKRVYETLSDFRHKNNGLPVFEPADSPDFLPYQPYREASTIDIQVPRTGVKNVSASVLVDCNKEKAFKYISDSDQLVNWLQKADGIPGETNVEILKGPYNRAGAMRKVFFSGGDSVIEELIHWDPFANYAYRATNFTNFFRKLTKEAFGQLWFDHMDGKTRITWVYSYTYKNAFAGAIIWLVNKMSFGKFMQHSLNNARDQIENAD
jgi:hypothetical protein